MPIQPGRGDVHVNRPLTNISLAFLQQAEAFVADSVFPNVPVSKQGDQYYTYDRGAFNRDEMQKRAPGAESAGGSYEISTDVYFAEVYAFHKDIADQVRANADDPINLDSEATNYVTLKALLKREKLWASNYFVGGVWTGGDIDGVASSPGAAEVLHWSDAASTPIEDIRTGRRVVRGSTGFAPNVLVLGREVFDILIDHPDIVARLDRGQTQGPAMVNRDALAALFELDRVLVMDAIENTAAEGQTASHSFIGGKKALLAYSAPSPGLMTPSAGYTFSWTGFLAATTVGSRIKQFRMEEKASDRVEIEMAFDQKLVAPDLGYFFDDIVA